MAVKIIHRPDDPDGIYYKELPELFLPGEELFFQKKFKEKHNDMLHTNGWSKDRTQRYMGAIPWNVHYQAIRDSGNIDYWRENNYRRVKVYLNENSTLRVGKTNGTR